MLAPIDITGIRLETERLILRPWRYDESEDLFDYASIEGLGQMAGWLPHESVETTQMILDSFITHKKTFALEYQGKVIGSLGVEAYDEQTYPELDGVAAREIGYVLSRDYWGHGLVPEAVQAVISWYFNTLRYDYLTCSHFDWNSQSKRVIEKCGFRYFSTTRSETQYKTMENSVNYIRYKENHT